MLLLLLRSMLLKSSIPTERRQKTVGTYATIQKLLNLWKQGQVKAEQIVGQILQYLVDWHKEFEELKLDVRKLKRQVEKLSSEK